MRHILTILLISCLALAPLGCGGTKESASKTFTSVGGNSTTTDREPSPKTTTTESTTEAKKGEPVFKGVESKKEVPTDDKSGSSGGPSSSPDVSLKVSEKSLPGVAEAVIGTATKPKMVKEAPLPSGVLTAGSFDDNLDPPMFQNFVRRMSSWQTFSNLHAQMSGQRLLVQVKDSGGKPVGGARVRLTGQGSSAELITRADGRTVFMLSFDKLPADQQLNLTVTPLDGQAVTETVTVGAPRWDITLPGVQARLPKKLDFAIILDTTGSMGDELRYINGEIRGIASAIQQKFPEVDQRFGLILYRDEGDEYVTRSFDFTAIDTFHRKLQAQSAGGGGDTPEAMHRGLEDANQLRWREGDTARVVFLIADAPPHVQHLGRTMTAVNALRQRGIAIYPIACSGYDDQCEFVMRSTAMLTGSQFLFLTDDSGVGGAHAEPKIPYYSVERLEKLVIRMVACELTGQRIDPGPGDIIRTVGKKVN